MYKIGLIGHKFEHLPDLNKATGIIKNTIDLLKYQYVNEYNDMVFNLGGERGVELIAGKYCLDNKIKYHLFIPAVPQKFTDSSWYDDQKEALYEQFKFAFSITTCSSNLNNIDYNSEKNRDDLLIDNSNFIVAFWTGKKIGRTYDIIQTALNKNKIVLNGFLELKLITKSDLKKE